MEQIRRLIDDDPYTTIEELEEQTGLTYSTIQTNHQRLFTAEKNYRSLYTQTSDRFPTN